MKDNETLSDNKFSMLSTSKIAACLKPVKIHNLAEKIKDEQLTASKDGGFLMQEEDEKLVIGAGIFPE